MLEVTLSVDVYDSNNFINKAPFSPSVLSDERNLK